MTSPRTRSADSSRPSYLAAPPLTQAEGAAEGAAILNEIEGPAGNVLAAALRDVMLWIEATPRRQRAAFHLGAGGIRNEQVRVAVEDPDLWSPLLVLALMAGDPESVGYGRVLHACQRIAEWAEARGAPATRLDFTQARALLRPRDAELALQVARLARELGDFARAESWFRHTVRLARNDDWESYVWAYVGLGVLYIRSGNPSAAQIVMLRALRTAERNRLRPLAGVAHHHLFYLSGETGQLRQAYMHARAALETYGTTHPRFKFLVADVGRFWINLGEYTRTRSVLEAVLPHLDLPNDRALILANITWASAGARDRDRYEAARSEAVGEIQQSSGRSHLAEAYLHLGYADYCVGEWARAEAMARSAADLAAASGEAEVRVLADTQVEFIRARQSRELATGTEPPVVAREAERLALDFVRALAASLS
jgi:tetratricopeptide (TPR) repeat protein